MSENFTHFKLRDYQVAAFHQSYFTRLDWMITCDCNVLSQLNLNSEVLFVAQLPRKGAFKLPLTGVVRDQVIQNINLESGDVNLSLFPTELVHHHLQKLKFKSFWESSSRLPTGTWDLSTNGNSLT